MQTGRDAIAKNKLKLLYLLNSAEIRLLETQLIRIVDELTSDPAQLMVMGAKARELAQPDSLEMIYHELEKLMEGV